MPLFKPCLPHLLVIASLICSCNKSNPDHKVSNPLHPLHKMTAANGVNSYDQLIRQYIQQSDNKLLQLAHKDHDKIEWIMDRTEDTDSAKYFVYNIGHDVAEDDSSNVRFVPYVWIYVDSLSKKVYEYDLSDDQLIEWPGQ